MPREGTHHYLLTVIASEIIKPECIALITSTAALDMSFQIA
jgi:hypothetical protein